jgi:hypothetical protein
VAGFDFETTVGDLFGMRGEIAFRYPIEYETRVYAPSPDLYYVAGADREFGDVHVSAQYMGRYVFDWTRVEPSPYNTDPLPVVSSIYPDPDAEPGEPGHEDICGPDNCNPAIKENVIEAINNELTLRSRLIHGQKEPVQHGFSLRAEWRTLHDTLSLVAFGVMNVSTLEWLIYPKVSYSITDAMTVSVGGEVYRGPKDTLFAMIEDILTAGYAELKISF